MKTTANIHVRRLNNTRNGNPRFEVMAYPLNADEGVIVGNTKGDSQFAYSMPVSGEAEVTWHVTPAGRCIITDVSRAKVAA